MSKIKSTSTKNFAAPNLKVRSSILPGQDSSSITGSISQLWTPKSLSGIKVWLDSSDESTLILSGTSVLRWLDKSGNGTDAYQSNSSYYPTYTGRQNGLPGITFNGSSQWFELDVFRSKCKHICVVFKHVNGGADNYRGILYARTVVSYTYTRISDATIGIGQDTSGARLQSSGDSVPVTYIYLNGASKSTVDAADYKIGIAITTGANMVNFSKTSNASGYKYFTIGRDNFTAGPGIRGWNSDIYEIIICEDELSDRDRQRLEGYLANKWGIPLPPTHPYVVITDESSYLYPSLDLDTRKFYNNLKATGGQIRPDSLKYVDTFVRELKANKLWDKINDMGVFVGNTYQAAMTKLKYVGSPYLIPYNVTDSAYSERGLAGGVKGNGTSIYLDTKHAATSSDYLNEHMCAYVKGTESDATNRTILGFWTDGSPSSSGSALGWQIGGVWDCGGFFTYSQLDFAPVNNTTKLDGFLLVTESGTTTRYYKDGVQYGNATTAINARVVAPKTYYALAVNWNGATSFCTRYLRFYSIGAGLNAVESAQFSASVNKLQASLNRL